MLLLDINLKDFKCQLHTYNNNEYSFYWSEVNCGVEEGGHIKGSKKAILEYVADISELVETIIGLVLDEYEPENNITDVLKYVMGVK